MSEDKRFTIFNEFRNGIKMYYQQIWVKGKYIVEKLNEIDYI